MDSTEVVRVAREAMKRLYWLTLKRDSQVDAVCLDIERRLVERDRPTLWYIHELFQQERRNGQVTAQSKGKHALASELPPGLEEFVTYLETKAQVDTEKVYRITVSGKPKAAIERELTTLAETGELPLWAFRMLQ
jgi:hypothetical protein